MTDEASYSALTPEQEVRLMRKLFISPGVVTLATDGALRWATDAFVLLNVTGTHLGSLPDGAYRFVASGPKAGYQARAGATLDAELALEFFAADLWERVVETGWSVYDSEAKLYLLRETVCAQPHAVNEDLWRSFHDQFPEAIWEVAPGLPKTRLRVINDNKVIAYVAGVEIETEQRGAAFALAAEVS